MFRKRKLFIALVLVFSSQGCGLFSGSSDDAEITFPKTDVGEPTGPAAAAAKSIGPEGGSIASADGRITVKIPPNDVSAAVNFSIQPITNKAEGGLGSGYRLEPNGQKFATPVEVSFKYTDQDLEGTVPEALTIGYQDEQRAWHLQEMVKLDQVAKTVTVSTTHFTDEAIIAGVRLLPASATIRVGSTQLIRLVNCQEQGIWDRLLSRRVHCSPVAGKSDWKLEGPGSILYAPAAGYAMGDGVEYTAPTKKPTPNIARVLLTAKFSSWDRETGATSEIIKNFEARVTIIDRGYRVTGQARDSVLSGVVCDPEKPFTVHAVGSLATFDIKFDPSSKSAKYVAVYSVVKEAGSGTYAIASDGGDGFDIVLDLAATATVAGHSVTSPRGVANIHLTPLNANEDGCGG